MFFLQGIIKTAQSAENEIHRIATLTNKDKAKIETLGRARINAQRVFNYLLHHPLTTIARTSKATGLSIPAVITNFKHLQKVGILREITGQAKNRVYEYEAYMRILDQDMEPLKE